MSGKLSKKVILVTIVLVGFIYLLSPSATPNAKRSSDHGSYIQSTTSVLKHDEENKLRFRTYSPTGLFTTKTSQKVRGESAPNVSIRANVMGSRDVKDKVHYPPEKFYYLGMPRKRICTDRTFLVIGVCSDVTRFDLRNAIRSTWGSETSLQKFGVLVIFVIGRQTGFADKEITKGLLDEANTHGDILHLDYVDNLRTLSMKTLGFYAWMKDFCHQAKYVMKTDDDVFINTKLLIRLLHSLEGSSPRYIIGHSIRGAKPVTDKSSKWHDPVAKGGPAQTYPTYLSGSGYVMPNVLVADLITASHRIAEFWLEDIYITGMVARAAGISLVDNSRFIINKPRGMGVCKFKESVLVHDINHIELKRIFLKLKHTDNRQCRRNNPVFSTSKVSKNMAIIKGFR